MSKSVKVSRKVMIVPTIAITAPKATSPWLIADSRLRFAAATLPAGGAGVFWRSFRLMNAGVCARR